ncbi:hypothetical protein AVEN_35013-1 [Araneus ventricosus]|uniref:Uncharacterized protein n=1 Tax=Araneus ventricosus TaxID=182803 RepID=A0A4Y2N0G3_ARAVE|nr:hypothetical protein AVEN_35013-1 [Araneus ventricosus]
MEMFTFFHALNSAGLVFKGTRFQRTVGFRGLNNNPFATLFKFQLILEERPSRAKPGSLQTRLKSYISSVIHSHKSHSSIEEKLCKVVETLCQKNQAWPAKGNAESTFLTAFADSFVIGKFYLHLKGCHTALHKIVPKEPRNPLKRN